MVVKCRTSAVASDIDFFMYTCSIRKGVVTIHSNILNISFIVLHVSTSNNELRLPFRGPYSIIVVYLLPKCIWAVVMNKKIT